MIFTPALLSVLSLSAVSGFPLKQQQDGDKLMIRRGPADMAQAAGHLVGFQRSLPQIIAAATHMEALTARASAGVDSIQGFSGVLSLVQCMVDTLLAKAETTCDTAEVGSVEEAKAQISTLLSNLNTAVTAATEQASKRDLSKVADTPLELYARSTTNDALAVLSDLQVQIASLMTDLVTLAQKGGETIEPTTKPTTTEPTPTVLYGSNGVPCPAATAENLGQYIPGCKGYGRRDVIEERDVTEQQLRKLLPALITILEQIPDLLVTQSADGTTIIGTSSTGSVASNLTSLLTDSTEYKDVVREFKQIVKSLKTSTSSSILPTATTTKAPAGATFAPQVRKKKTSSTKTKKTKTKTKHSGDDDDPSDDDDDDDDDDDKLTKTKKTKTTKTTKIRTKTKGKDDDDSDDDDDDDDDDDKPKTRKTTTGVVTRTIAPTVAPNATATIKTKTKSEDKTKTRKKPEDDDDSDSDDDDKKTSTKKNKKTSTKTKNRTKKDDDSDDDDDDSGKKGKVTKSDDKKKTTTRAFTTTVATTTASLDPAVRKAVAQAKASNNYQNTVSVTGTAAQSAATIAHGPFPRDLSDLLEGDGFRYVRRASSVQSKAAAKLSEKQMKLLEEILDELSTHKKSEKRDSEEISLQTINDLIVTLVGSGLSTTQEETAEVLAALSAQRKLDARDLVAGSEAQADLLA